VNSCLPLREAAGRWFWGLVIVTLMLKVAFALSTPVLFDEAYFALWGRRFDYGYYDHPPMVGWWLWLMGPLASTRLGLRMPAIAVSFAVAGLLVLRGDEVASGRGKRAATLWMISPLHLLSFPITTDTPLLLFGVWCVLEMETALQRHSKPRALWAGVLWGAALLSKYFAVLVFPALLLSFAVSAEKRKQLTLALLFLAGALPALALHCWWNATHCFTNLLFNLQNRNDDAAFSLVGPALLLLALVVFLGWPSIRLLIQPLRPWLPSTGENQNTLFTLMVARCGLGLLAALSLFKIIGAHWVLMFIPLVFLSVAAADDAQVGRAARALALTTGVLAILSGSLLLLQKPLLEAVRSRLPAHTVRELVLLTAPSTVAEALQAFPIEQWAALSYADASLLSWVGGRHVVVFGEGGRYARQDDFLNDVTQRDGTDMVLFGPAGVTLSQAAPYFEHVEVHSLVLNAVPFEIVVGRRLKARVYRENVGQNILRRFYQYPKWLRAKMRRCEVEVNLSVASP
jgi:LPXTG-motif cell wall-anchored protein